MSENRNHRAELFENLNSLRAQLYDAEVAARAACAEVATLKKIIAGIEEALGLIASCESRAPGDVVDIAREALATVRA